MKEGLTIIQSTGSRKSARARAVLKSPGRGWVYVNGKRPLAYFCRDELARHALEPLLKTDKMGKVDLKVRLEGGGVAGQAGAMRLAAAKALLALDPSLKELLRQEGLLTRDRRKHERNKYGRSKRRKSWQYSKR